MFGRKTYVFALALLFAIAAPAQMPEKFKESVCAGPLASLIPECQTAGSSMQVDSAALTRARAAMDQATPMSGADGGSGPKGDDKPKPAPAPRPAGDSAASDFQRLASSSLGRMLPIFGASLFENVPTTFAPIDRAPVATTYSIGPGDELLLRVWGQVNLNVSVTVDRLGDVYLPQVGTVHVAGVTYEKLPGFLKSHMDRVFRNYEMNVSMGQLRSVQIYVAGYARRPGSYTVSSVSTLVNAIFACGGPSPQGSMRAVQLKRGGKVAAEFDLYDLLRGGDKTNDTTLEAGDVIHFPPSGAQVAVGGSVREPAIYELKRETTLEQALALAGGPSVVADRRRLGIERIGANGTRETLEIAGEKQWARTLIGDGDVIRMMTVSPRFDNAVTLRGNVANPGRFPFRAGMRLRDVIPDKASLVSRDYWRHRNTVGFTRPEDDVPGTPGAEAARGYAATRVELHMPEINWAYAVIERQDGQDLSTQLIPFHLGKLVLERDEQNNLELKPGDVVTIFTQGDIRVPTSQQTRFVRLEGEFKTAGIFNIRAGETLGQVLQRAGGLTAEAYLFGAEFTRESVRAEQQRRLDQFASELEKEIDEAAREQLSGATSPERVTELSVRLASERRVARNLKAVRATGRVVLQLDPEHPNLEALHGMTLEDGDRLYIPPRPSAVHVLGAVYNANTFLHQSKLNVRKYIERAGGLTRSADAKRLFVIRADGTVVSKGSNTGIGKRFDSMTLFPGDAVVAPEHVLKSSPWKSVREWSQIAAQFAIGAAAVNVLR